MSCPPAGTLGLGAPSCKSPDALIRVPQHREKAEVFMTIRVERQTDGGGALRREKEVAATTI